MTVPRANGWWWKWAIAGVLVPLCVVALTSLGATVTHNVLRVTEVKETQARNATKVVELEGRIERQEERLHQRLQGLEKRLDRMEDKLDLLVRESKK